MTSAYNDPFERVFVQDSKQVTLTSHANPNRVKVGDRFHDTAKISGRYPAKYLDGAYVEFTAYEPVSGEPDMTAAKLLDAEKHPLTADQIDKLANGTEFEVSSSDVAADKAGTVNWQATLFTKDGIRLAGHEFGATDESVEVTGNGKVRSVSQKQGAVGGRMWDLIQVSNVTTGSENPEGFDIEIAKMVGAQLGFAPDQIDFVETVSANREPFIENGEVDIVVATYTINDKRKEVIDFAGPYYVAGQSFLVAKGNPAGIKDVETLGDNTICTVTGSTSEKNIKEHTDKVITVDKYSDCLEPIRTGQAQALTTDNVILAGLVDQNGDEFEVLDYTFTEEPYGIGLKKGDDDFRTFINDTLEESEKDGAWKKAWEDPAGKVLPTPEAPAVDRY